MAKARLSSVRFDEHAMVKPQAIEINRIDKYYMLVRRFVNASFRLLIREKWSKEALDQYTAVIAGPGGPLK